jgi:uncharacterized membrane protein
MENKVVNASITINSIPGNAEVSMNEKYQGSTPFHLSGVIPGKYMIEIEKEGFDKYQREIDIKSGQHPMLDVNLNASGGGLVILSEPAEAIIKLNGETIENRRTPLFLSELTASKHNIEIEKYGYANFSKSVELKAGKTDTLLVELSRLTARLSVQVRPWGSIYIDNQMKKSSTDLKFETELPVKEYMLKVTHPTLGLWERKVALKPEESTNLIIDFNKLFKLSVNAFDQDGNPISADIILDQQSTNLLTPAELPIRFGIHKIIVKKKGFVAENEDRTVLVDEAPLESLTFILKKIE